MNIFFLFGAHKILATAKIRLIYHLNTNCKLEVAAELDGRAVVVLMIKEVVCVVLFAPLAAKVSLQGAVASAGDLDVQLK